MFIPAHRLAEKASKLLFDPFKVERFVLAEFHHAADLCFKISIMLGDCPYMHLEQQWIDRLDTTVIHPRLDEADGILGGRLMLGPVASEIGRTIGNFGCEKARGLGILLAVFELRADILADHLGGIVLSIGSEEYFFPFVEDIDDDVFVKLFLARNIVVQLRLGETGAVRNALR